MALQAEMRSFNHIARLVRDRRLAHSKKYSQSELSTVLGYKNGQFISNVERGLCSIPLKMLGKLSEILEIAPLELKQVLLRDFEETLENYLKQGSGEVLSKRKQREQQSNLSRVA